MDDAKWFPIQAGGMLCGLYVMIKYFGKEVVNYLLMAYMGVGTGALFKDALMNIQFFANLNDKELFHLKCSPIGLDQKVTLLDVISLIFGECAVGVYLLTKNWIFNNLLASLFCVHGI